MSSFLLDVCDQLASQKRRLGWVLCKGAPGASAISWMQLWAFDIPKFFWCTASILTGQLILILGTKVFSIFCLEVWPKFCILQGL